jgi:hypothetical protein
MGKRTIKDTKSRNAFLIRKGRARKAQDRDFERVNRVVIDTSNSLGIGFQIHELLHSHSLFSTHQGDPFSYKPFSSQLTSIHSHLLPQLRFTRPMQPIQPPQAPKVNQKLLMMQIMHPRTTPQKVISTIKFSFLSLSPFFPPNLICNT